MIRINLLPVRAARKKENIRRQISVFFLCVFFFVAVMSYVAYHLSRNISELNAKIENAQAELTKLQAIVKQVNAMKQELDKLEAKMDIIAMLELNRAGPVRIMDALTSLVVAEKMWLTSLTEEGGQMSLAGVAMDNKTIADFMTRIEKSPYFKVVDLISSKQVQLKKDKVKFKEFTIICRLSDRWLKKGPKTS
jgi:type IV pilus assembly protein PilN